jgi:hypothetical protein
LFHAQRPKHGGLREAGEIRACNPPDDFLEHEEANVGVSEARARRCLERQGSDAPDGLGAPVLVVVEGRLGRQSRDMGEKLSNGDGALAAGCELRNVAGRSIVEIDLALVGQDHE